jgi:nicotinamidase-related amidase
MDRTTLLTELQRALPVQLSRPPLPEGRLGLVVVDAVVGFTRQGNLSDPTSMGPMVQAIDALVRDLDRRLGERLHVLLLQDSHHADIPEPPYPPHCVKGTGEDQMDPELQWLMDRPRTTALQKDCINGFVGGLQQRPDGRWGSRVTDWVADNELSALLLSGDCTDICVSDLTVALLSARNHGMLTRVPPGQREAYVAAITGLPIYVHAGACATFDLDPDDELPDGQQALRHPGPLAHHVGLWVSASRGAQLISGFA